MDSQHLNMISDIEEKQGNQESETSTPPSASSSPSHEFSFTISFQQTSSINTENSTKQIPPSSFAIDLSPADDIFFHGHLLPLQLLSHLPISPRSSTTSMDSFTHPIKDLFEDHHHKIQNSNNIQRVDEEYTSCDNTKGKSKAKSFSLFGLPKWRKGYEVNEKENKERHRRKLKFDVMSQVVKRYIRMVRPLLSFRNRKNMQFHSEAYSFSGNLINLRGKKKENIRGKTWQYSSAPASMSTSPTNSGLLVATPAGTNCSNSRDSAMEELQAAIQAAIAHCKKSISMEENIN